MDKLIWVMIGLDRNFGRQVMQGILNYRFSRTRYNWRFSIISRLPEAGSDFPKPDAIIGGVYNKEDEDKLSKFGCPVINISEPFDGCETPTVTVANYLIGQLAANHLSERRIDFAVYVYEAESFFVKRRCEGFFDKIPDSIPKIKFCILDDSFSIWLKNEAAAIVQKGQKIGVFAQNDELGQKVTEICHNENFTVPEQICVLGVDNAEIFCQMSYPELSSIETRPLEVGYKAAELAEVLMGGERPDKLLTYVQPDELIVRGSTELIEYKDPLIADAVGFIKNYATSGIDVSDVLRRIPLARRTLEYRFKSESGTTIYQFIQKVRLEKASQLLRDTTLTVEQIGRKCGYQSSVPFQTAFKKVNGMAPGIWRKRQMDENKAGE